MMACRSVPVPAPTPGSTPPLSPVLVTRKVDGTVRSSSGSTDNRVPGRRVAGRRRRGDPADVLVLRRENSVKNHIARLLRGGGLRYNKGAGWSARRPGAGAMRGR